MPVRPAAILIAGPTGSGKSALALRLAESLGGTVVNADSMQVYRDLRILTARPSVQDEARVTHRLYGHIDGAVNFSVGRWVEEAGALLAEIRKAGGLPVVVGGTGLYFKALTDGLSDLPRIPDEIRSALRHEAEGRPTAELHAELASRDPETAGGLRNSDRLRVLRALEVLRATGRSLRSFQARRTPGPLADAWTPAVFLTPDRTALRKTIDRRFEAMMASEALHEARALAGRGLDPALPIMRAHGVPGLLAHLRGEITLAEAVVRGQADTRAYVKRQFTWFRHQMTGFGAVLPEDAEALIRAILARAT